MPEQQTRSVQQEVGHQSGQRQAVRNVKLALEASDDFSAKPVMPLDENEKRDTPSQDQKEVEAAVLELKELFNEIETLVPSDASTDDKVVASELVKTQSWRDKVEVLSTLFPEGDGRLELPSEVCFLILLNMSPRDFLGTVSFVCKAWNLWAASVFEIRNSSNDSEVKWDAADCERLLLKEYMQPNIRSKFTKRDMNAQDIFYRYPAWTRYNSIYEKCSDQSVTKYQLNKLDSFVFYIAAHSYYDSQGPLAMLDAFKKNKSDKISLNNDKIFCFATEEDVKIYAQERYAKSQGKLDFYQVRLHEFACVKKRTLESSYVEMLEVAARSVTHIAAVNSQMESFKTLTMQT